ncbi:TetR/AcrR family transcriptional regulator [Nocardioides carbamazepini]|uniref:TetR/AcrR family transcriptional regulator n=1 Tax=Nocardioides carbamazepini TaxID=2854259 RepID=UPI002149A0D8|nr:TetR/AcrR family transcriptional regulator [Nocardioides carbamazepini]MCR1783768.1 TetR/AcrR family transcriptional regulator [Nocardioides carbamazepini]
MTAERKSDTRQELLEAAAALISDAPGQDVPLRAICERVGVKLPTLYHFFGSKDGLLEAVIDYGFESYLSLKKATEPTGDPVEDIRRGWDAHVRFGLDNAGFYALMYGQVTPHRRPAAAAGPHAALLRLCRDAEAQGRLAVPAAGAADHVLAANVGVTLFLITAEEPDLALAAQVRDATVAAITGVATPTSAAPDTRRLQARQMLQALSGAEKDLGRAEVALLRKWLSTLAGTDPA